MQQDAGLSSLQTATYICIQLLNLGPLFILLPNDLHTWNWVLAMVQEVPRMFPTGFRDTGMLSNGGCTSSLPRSQNTRHLSEEYEN